MTQVQGSNLLDVLKKKMRQTKEEMEKYKEESEDMARKLQVEICRREEVSWLRIGNKPGADIHRYQKVSSRDANKICRIKLQW